MQSRCKLFFTVSSLVILGMSLLPQMASAKTKYRTVLKHEYVQEPMYLCSVTNRTTGDVFYGKSPKQTFAAMYARSYCQMMSYSGQCYVKVNCNFEYVTVRKRKWVRQAVS